MLLSVFLIFGLCSRYHLASDAALFTETQKEEIEKNSEKFTYEADISRIMKIIINSLYKNKEIFIRELISNANDAIGKIKFMSFTNPEVLSTKEELGIWIDYNETKMTLTITDSGIGMTKDDLIKNLGTIAKSGTSDFLKKLQEEEQSSGSISAESLSNQIGQFGVGFYSSFLVAERVTVVSKHNDDDQYIWESDAVSFNVTKDPRGNTLGRGTAIILHLKKQAREYLLWSKLKELTNKYSSFIDYPIGLWGEKVDPDDDEKEKLKEKEEKKEKEKVDGENDDEEVKDDSEDKASDDDDDETYQKKYGYTIMNTVKPIWMRSPSNITDSEYTAFYRSLKNEEKANYLSKIHFIAEGDVVFRCLMYIPDTLPSQFMQEGDKPTGNVKLYVKRVYIKSDFHSLLPNYLNYISGIIDSDDLPLNVGRESLQHLQLVKVIKKKVVRKIIDSISKLDSETMVKFYKTFSASLKYGAIVDNVNRNRLLKILHFYSTYSGNEKMTTFIEYVSRMKEKQEKLYYLSASDFDDCKNSPYVTPFVARGYEVLCMLDPMDEYLFTHISDFENRNFQNVAKDGAELPDDDSSDKEKAKEYQPLLDFLPKHSKLSSKIEKAEVGFDIEPACLLIANKFGFTGNMERIYNSQTSQSSVEKSGMKETMARKKNLKLNGNHPVVKAMLDHVEDGNAVSDEFDELSRICYSIGQLYGGFVHENHKKLGEVMQDLAVKAMGQDPKEVRKRIKKKISSPKEEQDDEDDETTDKTHTGEQEL